MKNKKLKKALIILLCGIQLVATLPMIPRKEVKASVSESVSVDNSNLLPVWSKATNASIDTPDWLASAIIVEVNLDHVSVEGTLSGAYKLLDYYEELGVNCLWVLPVNDKGENKQGENQDNGYINRGLHTIDLKLSEAQTYEEGWEHFADFVTAAHNRNIRILLDVVPWGVSYDSPMAPLSIDKYEEQYAGIVTETEDSWGGYKYNYSSEVFQSYYRETMLDIIETTGIDGLRADLAPWTEGQTDLLNSIRQASYAAGNPIVIMSEGATNNRVTGGDSASTATTRTYDLEQMGVIDMNNHDTYFNWDEEWLAKHDENTQQALKTDNWTSNVYAPPDWWYKNNIVDTIKNGKIMAGTNWEQRLYQTGKHQYYTNALSFHDYAVRARNDTLSFGYQAIFAPVIPLWYMGDELADKKVNSAQNVLYFSGTVNMNLLEDNETAAFYNKIKKYIQIRRTYSDIFEYFPKESAGGTRESNICKVSVTGVNTHQAYARYANKKAVLVVPNGTESDANITVTVPVSAAGIGTNYTVKNLMTEETLTVSNDKITITVEAGDLAVILVDGNSSDATTGCEEVVQANKTRQASISNAVKTADAAIKALATTGRLTGSLVTTARSAYNALSDGEKLMVDGYALAEAEKKYAAVSAHSNICYANTIQMSDLYPHVTTKADWSWGDDIMTMEELTTGGVKVAYQKDCVKDYRVEIVRPVRLDGAHFSFSLTEKEDYYDKQINVSLASSHGLAPSSNKLTLKISPVSGQVFITSGGTAVDHSDMPGYNANHPDRVFLDIGYHIEMTFRFSESGNLIINLNGYDLEINQSELAKSTELTDLDNVYFYFEPNGSAPEITMHYLHEAEDMCAQDTCDSYRVTGADIYPNGSAGDTDWNAYRTLTDTDTGVQVEYISGFNTPTYSHSTRNTLSANGAHMKLTLTSGYKINICISTVSGNSTGPGINFQIGYEGYLYPSIDGTNLISTYGSDYSDYSTLNNDRVVIPSDVQSSMATTLEIKTDIRENGDFVFTINGFDFVVKKAHWYESTNLNHGNDVYFKVGPGGRQVNYTWNYLHGGEDACYDEIAEIEGVESLITTMTTNQTSENVVAARKAYLALSEEAKVCVDNRAYLDFENGAGVRLEDANLHLLTKSDIYRWYRTDWDAARTITQADDGVRITHTASGIAQDYMHPIHQAVDVDGAHMKLTVHNPESTRFYVILSNGANTLTTEGLSFRIYPAASDLGIGRNAFSLIDHTGYQEYNSSTQRISLPTTVCSGTTTEYDIKTKMQGSNLVFTINGYSIEVKEATLKEAINLTDLTKVYFKIAPGGSGYPAVDYTINYLHGGEEVCWQELCDVETKIDFCHPTKPIKGNLDAAKNAYNALDATEKEIVMNLDTLTISEKNAKENDFYHNGLTASSVSGSNSWGVTVGQVSEGYNIDYSTSSLTGMSRQFRYRFDKSIYLDGAHIGVTLPVDNTNSKFYLSLSNSNDNDLVGDLDLKIDLRNGSNFLYADGTGTADTSGLFGYNGANKDRIKFPSIGTNELDIRFYVDNNESLYVTVNGYYITFTQEQLAKLNGFDINKPIYVGVSPDATKPNITFNYIVSGKKAGSDYADHSYDVITGDVNNDSTTNVLDLVRMKRYEAATDKNKVLISYYRSASDLDENGTVGDTADLAGLRQELAGAN